MCIRAMLVSVSFFIILVASAPASGGSAVLYVCAEERAVGWEEREGQRDVIGRFQPSDDKIFVKWFPPSPEGHPLVLPRIEVTKGSKEPDSMTYANCDLGSRFLTREIAEQGCRDLIKQGWWSSYGTSMKMMSFNTDPGQQKPSIQFTTFLNVIRNAYLERGTCVLAAQ